MRDNLSVESHIVARFILTSLSIDEMLTSLYVVSNLLTSLYVVSNLLTSLYLVSNFYMRDIGRIPYSR